MDKTVYEDAELFERYHMAVHGLLVLYLHDAVFTRGIAPLDAMSKVISIHDEVANRLSDGDS